jgi:hypothetical protein
VVCRPLVQNCGLRHSLPRTAQLYAHGRTMVLGTVQDVQAVFAALPSWRAAAATAHAAPAPEATTGAGYSQRHPYALAAAGAVTSTASSRAWQWSHSGGRYPATYRQGLHFTSPTPVAAPKRISCTVWESHHVGASAAPYQRQRQHKGTKLSFAAAAI